MCRSITLFLLLCLPEFPLPAQQKPVTPELGGPGFEKIAERLGWETAYLSDDQLRHLADPNATKGGSIRIGIDEYPATFRAYGKDGQTNTNRTIEGLVYEPLLTVNPLTLDLLPELASHWKVEEDGQTYWFRIDPRARFADGTPVTTDDIIATYDLLVDPRILDPYINTFYDGFDPPKAISPYIFTVHAVERNWKNLIYFGGTYVLPASILDEINGEQYIRRWNYRTLPGSGPYEIRETDIVDGKRVTLTRRKDWWHVDDPQYAGQHNFDSLSFIVAGDENSRLEKFKKGEIDFYLTSRAQWWEERFDFGAVHRGLIQKREVYNNRPQGLNGFVFNMRRPPFNDLKVREAFTLLFNREQLIDSVMFGAYKIADSYFPNSEYANPNNLRYRYNPERAQQLLREAGYTKRNDEGILVHEKTGKSFVIELPITGGSEHIMTPVRQDLKAAGIRMDVRYVDWAQQIKLQNEWNFDVVYISYAGIIYPNPTGQFHSNMADIPNTQNLSGFKNQRADELIEEELETYDQQERVTIFRELDGILMSSHCYALSWYAPFTRVAYWNKFGHPDFYLGRISGWEDILRLWWYDPDKAATVENGIKDPSITMPVGPTDVRFWNDYDKR